MIMVHSSKAKNLQSSQNI